MYERKPRYTTTLFDIYAIRPQILSRFSDMHNWKLTEGELDMRGWNLVDKDRNQVGRVDDFLVSPEEGEAVFALISYGGLLGINGKRVLIPLDQLYADRDNSQLIFQGTEDFIKDAPGFTEDVRNFNPYYQYWQGFSRIPRDVPGQEDLRKRVNLAEKAHEDAEIRLREFEMRTPRLRQEHFEREHYRTHHDYHPESLLKQQFRLTVVRIEADQKNIYDEEDELY